MVDAPTCVGFVHDGTLSGEQEAALSWLEDRRFRVSSVPFDDLGDLPGEIEVLWWHREDPLEPTNPLAAAAPAVEGFLASGGGLLLTLRGMRAVDELGVETVPPDVVEVTEVGEPTGLLWRTLYADHRAFAGFDGLRVRVCEDERVPVARYERVLPARGEILASTVRGKADVPHEMTAVSWNAGEGAVIGVGAPLAFDAAVAEPLSANRNDVVAGCLYALAAGGEQPARPKNPSELHAMRERTAGSTRPDYHLTPPANWLNDPNGLIRWNGRYHVFYQYNPAGPFHNTIHWGHAVSDDLVTWEDEPVALSPSPDGPDRDGCWSGCAVDDDGTPTILYTGGNGRTQLPCLATAADDGLCRWEKYPDNPVIPAVPGEIDIPETEHWEAEFRDHSVWRAEGTWHQLVGSGVVDAGGAALLYTSEDLREWTYEGPLFVGDGSTGAVWECPELLDLGEKQLLHVSNYEDVLYFVGELHDGEFELDRRGTLDHGDFYAPQSMDDGDRYLTWGWLPEARDVSAQWEAGWSGALSLPRVITYEDGRVRQRPAEEVTALRERELPVPESMELAPGEWRTLETAGNALELDLEVRLADASAFELSVFEAPDGGECTPIRYTLDGTLSVDRSPASCDRRATADVQSMPVPPHDDPLSLRVFLDGSVVELYANGRHCLTSRVYPTRADSTGVSLVAEDGRATVSSLSAWTLGSAFPTRREPAASRRG